MFQVVMSLWTLMSPSKHFITRMKKNLSKVCLVKIPSEDKCCLQVFVGDHAMKSERAVSVSACGGI